MYGGSERRYIFPLNSRCLHPQFMRVINNGCNAPHSPPHNNMQVSLSKILPGFVPVLISSMHDGQGLLRPRLGSNSSLQPIGKIKRNSRIAIIIYEHLSS